MEDMLAMSTQDLDRLKVIHTVLSRKRTWPQAAAQLRLTVRQIGTLCARVRREGPRGILHRLRGRPSNRRVPAAVLAKALALVAAKYPAFGPTFANETLRERHGVRLSTATLRRAMIMAGRWRPRRHRPVPRARRERRPCVGRLVQVDGSEHAWFEGRGPRCTLLRYIDDATSRIVYAEFVQSEDTLTLLRTTPTYLLRYGRPVAWYGDHDSLYTVNRQPSIEEQWRDVQPMTQFTRAMTELDIEVILAQSPQATGRVERSFKTHQDRLVKELRLRGIATLAAATRFLWTPYLPAHNARSAHEPTQSTDAHRPLRPEHRVMEMLSVRTERVVRADWTIRFQPAWLQRPAQQPVSVRPGQTVLVEIRVDGSLHVRYKGHLLALTREQPSSAPARGKLAAHHALRSDDRPQGRVHGHAAREIHAPSSKSHAEKCPWSAPRTVTPSPHHPWRRRLLGPHRDSGPYAITSAAHHARPAHAISKERKP